MASISASHKKIQIGFLITTIFIFILSIYSFVRIKLFIANSQLVNQAHVIKLELEKTISNLKDLETGQRGYMLTKDSTFLMPFYEVEKTLTNRINKLYLLTSENREQQKNVVKLKLVVEKRIQHLKSVLSDAEKKNISKDRWLAGKAVMDEAREQVNKMITLEDQLLDARTQRLNDGMFFTPFITVVLIVCSLLILVLSYYRITKALNASYILQQNLSRSEEFLRQANAQLEENRIQQLLINESLQQKNQELGSMNKELESFAYVSSHDLQEPLRKIQMFVSRILDKEEKNLSDTGKDYFSRMRNAAKRMQQLIDDLLTYSRTNTTERNFKLTNLNQIVEDVREDFKETLHEKNATIIFNESCNVNIIPFQFRQLMHNLIGNSLKFAKPQIAPQILIKTEYVKRDAPGGENHAHQKEYCHISISDNGIGFDPQYKERIFEVFQRLHGREQYQGTGIGLAIVKKIVENHHGIITATSEIDKGAIFDIYIPA